MDIVFLINALLMLAVAAWRGSVRRLRGLATPLRAGRKGWPKPGARRRRAEAVAAGRDEA
jgi:hypothetical protein